MLLRLVAVCTKKAAFCGADPITVQSKDKIREPPVSSEVVAPLGVQVV